MAFARRARATAANLAFAITLNLRQDRATVLPRPRALFALDFAHRARCAAAMRLRPAALIRTILFREVAAEAGPPRRRLSSYSEGSIHSLTPTIRLNCAADRFNNSFI